MGKTLLCRCHSCHRVHNDLIQRRASTLLSSLSTYCITLWRLLESIFSLSLPYVRAIYIYIYAYDYRSRQTWKPWNRKWSGSSRAWTKSQFKVKTLVTRWLRSDQKSVPVLVVIKIDVNLAYDFVWMRYKKQDEFDHLTSLKTVSWFRLRRQHRRKRQIVMLMCHTKSHLSIYLYIYIYDMWHCVISSIGWKTSGRSSLIEAFGVHFPAPVAAQEVGPSCHTFSILSSYYIYMYYTYTYIYIYRLTWLISG